MYLPDENDEDIKKWFDIQKQNKKDFESIDEFVYLLKKVFKKYIDLDLFGFMFPN
jgi:hypothetical protein